MHVKSASSVQAEFSSTGANNSGILINETSGANQAIVHFQSNGSSIWQVGKASDNSFQIRDVANSRNVIQSTTTGNVYLAGSGTGDVGIGSTLPSQKLHVSGNIYVSGTTTTCTLGNGSGGTSCSSDERLKTNITPIEDSLSKILNLRGVEFDWNQKSGRAGIHSIGVIAQEVEKQFPTAVVEDKATGYKQVDYSVLVAPIIQSIKEFYVYVINQFKEQSREIASKADQTEVDRLKAENQMLKDYLCSKDPTADFCQRK